MKPTKTETTMEQKRLFPLLLLAGIFLFLSIPTDAMLKGKVDFTGKWALNEEKSTLGEFRGFSALALMVKQEKDAMQIERTRMGRDGETRTQSENLTTDGNKNMDEGENRTTASVATWSKDGKSLSIQYDIEFNRQGETFTMKRSEVWTLDETGKVLTIQSNSTSQRGETSVTLVYDKE
jgi:hypothetical protein